ncbi:hypothetical protein HII36_10995 [Nonomuraea sp. NN258]|uniref:hypothetical protein n=1 Tax=Nonomuraea antri TaxID=2730852 RepID=UPI001567EA1E|nr:hypothetical protein [Nonomuraea antri]NRQ32361.1 hypothetical protein [Nonomuraea antri]
MTLRLLALLALIAAALAGTATAAHACDCATLSPAKAVGHAKTVFTGTVVAIRSDSMNPLGPSEPNVYTFRADTVYKGAPAAEYTVATNVGGAACGYAFERGARYLVFAGTDPSVLNETAPRAALSSSLCAGNVPVEPGSGPLSPGDERAVHHESFSGPITAELIAALGPARNATPAPASAPVTTPAPVAAADESRAGGIWLLIGAAAALALTLTAGLTLLIRRRRAS